MTTSVAGRSRVRNARGQGAALRADIVAAAGRLLDQTGRDDAITLRAVAREVGVSAPSLYLHFADRDAMLEAVVDETFASLVATLERATAGIDDPVARLHAGCRAYLDFARDVPHRYALLFTSPNSWATEPKADPEYDTGAQAFNVLVDRIADCARAGRSTSTDPYADATALWTAMHGYAMLRANRPAFAWPPGDTVPEHQISALARIVDDAAPRPAPRKRSPRRP